MVNDTPMVSGGNVTVDVAVGGACPDTFECTIDGSERDCEFCGLHVIDKYGRWEEAT